MRTMLGRAVRRHCPICGGGNLFTGWLRMGSHCPTCGLSFHRGEDGYTLGALWFNLMMAEGFTMVTFLTTLYVTWPDPPWDRLQYTGPAEAVIMPFVFYPFARTLFLAFDLGFRPLDPAELQLRAQLAAGG
jgi:uncharacterized protein (DUF983 family)